MTSVSTRRHDRINSNVEERQRRGYEIRTGFTWAEIGGSPAVRHADVSAPDGETHGNLRLRAHGNAYPHQPRMGDAQGPKAEIGYLLDIDKGRWQARPGDEDPDDPMSNRVKRVIPYVEDRRNTLVFTPTAW